QDLQKLGVLLGHRRKILRAISELGTAVRAEKTPAGPRRRADTERRHLTVMFCDLVGSTALSKSMDPEDYGDLIRSYRETCSRIVRDGGGLIARLVGDGMLAYFGYPAAHEDNPVRACRARLGIIDPLA